MSKFLLLVKQLYKQKVKAKSFLLTIALYTVVIAGVVFWNNISEILFSDEPMQVAIVDETASDAGTLIVESDDLEITEFDGSLDEATEQVDSEELDIAIHLEDNAGQLAATIYTYEPLSFTTQSTLSSQLDYAGKL